MCVQLYPPICTCTPVSNSTAVFIALFVFNSTAVFIVSNLLSILLLGDFGINIQPYVIKMQVPEFDAKHLKLLSQNPQTKMTSQLGRDVKQAAEAETL